MGMGDQADRGASGEAPAELNRSYWNRESDEYQAEHGEVLTETARAWGVWRIPESEVGALGDVRGTDVLELGCGAAQWSIALSQDGARVVGMDLSDRQLAHARRAVGAAGVHVPLVQAAGQRLPFADGSFDLVFCDHGALSFADPEVAIPEAARVLRRGGVLAFCVPTPLLFTAWDWEVDRVSRTLHQDYFDLGPQRVPEGYYEYQLPYGAWIRLFRLAGLVLEDLIELRPPDGATTTYELVDLEWARRWPAEHIWKLRKGGPRLVGVAEAAAILGWDKRRLITYVDRGSFPEPLESLAGGRVWALDDVLAFRQRFRARRRERGSG